MGQCVPWGAGQGVTRRLRSLFRRVATPPCAPGDALLRPNRPHPREAAEKKLNAQSGNPFLTCHSGQLPLLGLCQPYSQTPLKVVGWDLNKGRTVCDVGGCDDVLKPTLTRIRLGVRIIAPLCRRPDFPCDTKPPQYSHHRARRSRQNHLGRSAAPAIRHLERA